MLFNSISYAFFLPIVFSAYWLISENRVKTRNFLLLTASYFFYACWDVKFLLLLVFSTLLDFYSGIKIENSQNLKEKTIWFWLSIITNLGILCIFKYYNFFIDTINDSFHHFGVNLNIWTLRLILPIGISFYTFHGLSYIIDIYKSKIKAERDFIHYSLFVSFFPLLVAGPIERATHLLPQLKKIKEFDYQKAKEGLRQILWGLFKKIVIADNCAEFANLIFDNANAYNGSTLLIGAFFFSIQIYGDFSGYSDIALGTAKLFGIELLQNFSFPYLSRDIAEFWRRWHISLSSWFKDYLYFPLGGSKNGMLITIRNTFIIFIISGLWHGANWTFVIWGLLNALFILPSIIFNTNRKNLNVVSEGKNLPSIKELISIVITFGLVSFAWIFFRAENMDHAFLIVNKLFSTSLFQIPYFPNARLALPAVIFTIIMFVTEWFYRENKFCLANFDHHLSRSFRWVIYYLLIFCIFYFTGKEQQFIYFQF